MVGYNLAVQLQKAEQADAYEELLQVIQKNDELSREVVAQYQAKLNTQFNDYNKLTQELKHVKISNGKCNITPDGVRLWNNSTLGEAAASAIVPKDTARVISSTETSSATTLEELMENKIKNDEICNGLRNQINSIRKWDKEVWNGSNSTGNKE